MKALHPKRGSSRFSLEECVALIFYIVNQFGRLFTTQTITARSHLNEVKSREVSFSSVHRDCNYFFVKAAVLKDESF